MSSVIDKRLKVQDFLTFQIKRSTLRPSSQS
nr:MAG TPA: hypothetical protein [Caudoviricetes sp.]